MQEGVLLETNIDKRSTDAGHYLGYLAKIDVPHHAFLTRGFNEELGESALFKNGDTMFVRRGIDDNFFFHEVTRSTTDPTRLVGDA
jgi:hypothetical protein